MASALGRGLKLSLRRGGVFQEDGVGLADSDRIRAEAKESTGCIEGFLKAENCF
jgi:hypothetical protein